MQLFKHGVLLGTLLILGLLSEQIISKEPDAYCTIQVNEPDASSWQNNVSVTCKPSSYLDNFTYDDVPLTMVNVVRAKIKDDTFCKWRYQLSSREVDRLLRLDYAYIVVALLRLNQLTDYGISELWSLYKDGCWKFWKRNECERELKQILQERAKRREQKKLQKEEEEHRQRLFIQKQKDIQKQKEQEKRNLEIYNKELLVSDYQSPYLHARKQALQKTQKEQYQKYEQRHELDAQTIDFCIVQNIDYQKLQQCTGTAMQHQLYDEVADCYKKIATFFCQSTLSESILAQQSLEFAQCVSQATELEAMELAIALSDLAHCCANVACWIISETKEAVQNFVNNITDPIGSACNVVDMAKSIGSCLGKVMNYVAQAMLHADSESLGWSHYVQVLEQEHQYDAEYAQQVVDSMRLWVEHSSAQEKVRVGTRCVIDGILYGSLCKFLSQTSKACCGLIADIPELRFLGEFSDVYAEYGLATELGDIGLSSLEKTGMSLMEFEVKAAVAKSEIFLDTTQKVIKNTKKPVSKCKIFQDISAKDFKEKVKGSDKLIKIIENRRSFTANGANGVANNVNGKKLLMKKLQIIEDFEQIAVEKKVLPDGRIRYYEMETPVATPGPTRGSGLVVEHDVKRGKVRAWYESRDHQGKVNRVNPKFLNGQEVFSQHYPPIAKDLKFFEVNPKKR